MKKIKVMELPRGGVLEVDDEWKIVGFQTKEAIDGQKLKYVHFVLLERDENPIEMRARLDEEADEIEEEFENFQPRTGI